MAHGKQRYVPAFKPLVLVLAPAKRLKSRWQCGEIVYEAPLFRRRDGKEHAQELLHMNMQDCM